MSGMNKASSAARVKWSRLIAAQGGSGKSVARFCAERGIPASSLFAWRRRLRATADPAPLASGFVEARVAGEAPQGCGVTIELGGGRRVSVARGFDRQLLLDVIEALEPARATKEAS